jgi:Cof subfamily protein (haloacid dehalogenase superfamily)
MSPRAPIRLVIADVDGTLVTGEKILTQQAMAAVHDLHAAGIAFAVTSGRPPRGMQMLVEPLALRTPIAGFNGGTIVNPDLSVIETRTLAPAAARAAIDIIVGQRLDAWLYTSEQWLVHDAQAPHVAREAWTVKYQPGVVASFGDDLLAHAVKIVGVSDDHAAVEGAERAAQQQLGTQAAASRSQPYYLDVTHPQANKGAVVDRLADLLGIPRDCIATIGDGLNDVLMFQRSGFSIAMGNASDAVKAHAAVITDSNENQGFAAAMRKFILEPADNAGAGA